MWIPLNSDRAPGRARASSCGATSSRSSRRSTGVAGIQIFGRLDREIRIWLDGEALRARGLAATDVLEALRREHVEIPGGLVESREIEYSVKTDAEYATLDELAQHGRGLRRRRAGAAARRGARRGRPRGPAHDRPLRRHAGRGLRRDEAVRRATRSRSPTRSARASTEIQETLPAGMRFKQGEGVADFSALDPRGGRGDDLLAPVRRRSWPTLTVFAFLRRWRPTLIVGARDPGLAGHDLRLHVDPRLHAQHDDAPRHDARRRRRDRRRDRRAREHRAAPRHGAVVAARRRRRARRQIAFAATAATLSIAAVFVPVIFVEGIVGNFLGEFGATVAISVLISLVVALTLTPMLAARVPAAARSARTAASTTGSSAPSSGSRRSYERLLDWTLGHRWTHARHRGASRSSSRSSSARSSAPSSSRPRTRAASSSSSRRRRARASRARSRSWRRTRSGSSPSPRSRASSRRAGTGRQGAGPPQPTDGVMFAMLKQPREAASGAPRSSCVDARARATADPRPAGQGERHVRHDDRRASSGQFADRPARQRRPRHARPSSRPA